LRYAWTGGFIDGFPYWKGNGSSIAQLRGEVKYKELESPFGSEGERKFLGYGLKEGFPVFRYQVGSNTVTEGYSAISEGAGFVRSFTISPAPTAPLVLDFPAVSGVTISSSKGNLEGSKLTLQPAEAAAFTLTFSLK
jgi:hypothetical protein